MARRNSKPEEEKVAGRPLETIESMPEQDLTEHFVEEVASEKGAMVDINALVQATLRDAYMQSEKDLHHFAQRRLALSKRQMNL